MSWFKVKPEHHTRFNTLTPEWMAKRWIAWVGDGQATNLLIARIESNKVTENTEFNVTDGIWYGDSTRGMGDKGSKPVNGDRGWYTVRWQGVMAASSINCTSPQLLTNSLVLVWQAKDLFGMRNLVSMSSNASLTTIRAMGRMYRSLQIGPEFYMGSGGLGSGKGILPIFADPDKFSPSMTGSNYGMAPVVDGQGNLSLLFYAEEKLVQRFDFGQTMDRQTAQALVKVRQAVDLIGPDTKPGRRDMGWAEKSWEIFDSQIRPYMEQVRRFTMNMDEDADYVRKCGNLATLIHLTADYDRLPLSLSNWVENWRGAK